MSFFRHLCGTTAADDDDVDAPGLTHAARLAKALGLKGAVDDASESPRPLPAPAARDPYAVDDTSCLSVPTNMKQPYRMGVLARLIATCCAQYPPCSLDVFSDTNHRLLFHYDMAIDGMETMHAAPPMAEHACRLSFAGTQLSPGRLHTDFTWLAQFVADAVTGVHSHLMVTLRYTGEHGDDQEAINKIRNVLSSEIMSSLTHDSQRHPIGKVSMSLPSATDPGAYNHFTLYGSTAAAEH